MDNRVQKYREFNRKFGYMPNPPMRMTQAKCLELVDEALRTGKVPPEIAASDDPPGTISD